MLKPGDHAVQIRRVGARTRVRRRVDERIVRVALFGDAQSDLGGAAFDERALALVRNVRATVLGDCILRTGQEILQRTCGLEYAHGRNGGRNGTQTWNSHTYLQPPDFRALALERLDASLNRNFALLRRRPVGRLAVRFELSCARGRGARRSEGRGALVNIGAVDEALLNEASE